MGKRVMEPLAINLSYVGLWKKKVPGSLTLRREDAVKCLVQEALAAQCRSDVLAGSSCSSQVLHSAVAPLEVAHPRLSQCSYLNRM